MVKYRTGPESESTARTIHAGTQNILQAQMGYAEQLNRLGQSIAGGIRGIGEKWEQRRQQEQLFEQQQALQEQRISGQERIQAQRSEAEMAQIKEQAVAKETAVERERRFKAATDPDITFNEQTGEYEPSPLATRRAAQEYNIGRRQQRNLESMIRDREARRDLEAAKMALQSEEDRRDTELRLEGDVRKQISGIYSERRKLLAGQQIDFLGLGVSGEGADTKSQEGMQDLMRKSHEFEKAIAFQHAARTGDDQFIPRNSSEYAEMLQHRAQVLDMMNSMPGMQQEAMRRGPEWTKKKLTRIATQLMLLGRSPKLRAMYQQYYLQRQQPQQPGGGQAGQAPGGQQPPGAGGQGEGLSPQRR